jgi:hypothetical protein
MANTRTGKFKGGDDAHPASGNVSLTEEVVKLENVNISDAPDARVVLTTKFDEATGVRVGPLKSFTGTHEYPVPAGTDLSKIDSVIVWCDKFSVSIALAALT